MDPAQAALEPAHMKAVILIGAAKGRLGRQVWWQGLADAYALHPPAG